MPDFNFVAPAGREHTWYGTSFRHHCTQGGAHAHVTKYSLRIVTLSLRNRSDDRGQDTWLYSPESLRQLGTFLLEMADDLDSDRPWEPVPAEQSEQSVTETMCERRLSVFSGNLHAITT